MRAVVAHIELRTGTVVAELGVRTVIAIDGIAVCRLVKINIERTVIRGVGSVNKIGDTVAGDYRSGLIGEGVDATCIVELRGKMVDVIPGDAVVGHSAFERGPAPPYTDT